MNDIRSVDFSDAQLKSLLFEVYSAGFEAGYPRCTDIHTGFNTWYRDVIQKDNLPVYAALDSTDKDVRDAIDSVCCIKTILYSGIKRFHHRKVLRYHPSLASSHKRSAV